MGLNRSWLCEEASTKSRALEVGGAASTLLPTKPCPSPNLDPHLHPSSYPFIMNW